MADNDLAKIVSLIMENPRLIDEIKNLASTNGKTQSTESEDTEVASPIVPEEKTSPTLSNITYTTSESDPRTKRKDLLTAIKPYVSPERGKAIESMMSIVDIIDMIRSK
jgi:hypothetical protein